VTPMEYSEEKILVQKLILLMLSKEVQAFLDVLYRLYLLEAAKENVKQYPVKDEAEKPLRRPPSLPLSLPTLSHSPTY